MSSQFLLRNFAQRRVTDSAGAVVQQARVELQPSGAFTATDQNGDFQLSDVAPRESFRTVVKPGEPIRVNAVLELGTQNEAVTVHADRQGGEVEALDIERTADNILQVLPADVITSLPNTNIADAVGRLPSVSLERGNTFRFAALSRGSAT